MKNLSFHISSNRWPAIALSKVISIDKVSKLTGHVRLRETQLFARIVNEEPDKTTNIFYDKNDE